MSLNKSGIYQWAISTDEELEPVIDRFIDWIIVNKYKIDSTDIFNDLGKVPKFMSRLLCQFKREVN